MAQSEKVRETQRQDVAQRVRRCERERHTKTERTWHRESEKVRETQRQRGRGTESEKVRETQR